MYLILYMIYKKASSDWLISLSTDADITTYRMGWGFSHIVWRYLALFGRHFDFL